MPGGLTAWPAWPLLALAAVALMRLGELLYARHTARKLASAGARKVVDDGMGAIVAVHALWFVAFALEATLLGRFVPDMPAWLTVAALVIFAIGMGLRYWSMAALGSRWNTRVWVMAAPLVTKGPYRFLRHPIYVGVWLELVALPLAFGLWGTAAGAAVAKLLVVRRRIRKEEAALGIAKPKSAQVAARP